MAEQIELQKLKEEYPDFFRKTSHELIDFILSEKTSEKIADIAVKNGVDDEKKVGEITQRIIWVLLGKLPSGNLAMSLKSWVGLASETAKKVADETNQFISSAMVQIKSGGNAQSKPEPLEEETIEEKSKKPSSKDVYREQI